MSLVSRSGSDPDRPIGRRVFRLAVVAAVVLALGPALAGEREGEAAEVKSALEKFDAALEKEQGLNPDTKAALKDLIGAIDVAAPVSVQGTSVPPQTPTAANAMFDEILKRVHPYGDVRVREEYNWNLDDMRDVQRIRARLRLGTTVDVTDDFSAGARITAGDPTSPESPHQTLGGTFDGYEWNFDRAFIRYSPEAVPGLFVDGGKFEHPFFRNPVYGNAVWDSDIQAEGFLAGYLLAHEEGMLRQLSFYFGEYLLYSQPGVGKDSWATVMQVAAALGLQDNMGLDFAFGTYIWHDVDPDGSNAISAENRGNELDPNGNFAHDFLTIHTIIAYHMMMGGIPLTVSTELGANARTGSRDKLYGIGFAVGKKDKAGDWRFYWNYIVVEQNAVLSIVSGDDTLINVNSKNHITGASYNLAENVLIHIWLLSSSRAHREPVVGNDSKKWQHRGRIDLELKF